MLRIEDIVGRIRQGMTRYGISSDTANLTEILDYIQEGIGKIMVDARVENVVKIALTDGVYKYPFTYKGYPVSGVVAVETPTDWNTPLDYIPIERWNEVYHGGKEGVPTLFTLTDGVVMFYPIPKGVTGQIIKFFVKVGGTEDSVSLDMELPLPAVFAHALENFVLYSIAPLDKKSMFLQIYDKEIRDNRPAIHRKPVQKQKAIKW